MKGLVFPATVESVRTLKDRTIRITIGSQEMTPEEGGRLLSMSNTLATVYIKPEHITEKELEAVDNVNPDLPGKSQSERLRNVLYVLWNQDSEGFKDFNSYYQYKTNLWIESLKKRIKEPA